MTKDRPDWEEAERRRMERENGMSLLYGSGWERPANFEEKVGCTTCHDFASSNPEIMALHALGCRVEKLVPLAVVVEAELLLMAAYAEQHGCGCPKHRPWSVA